MKCTNCGNENKEGSKFCFKCGSKLIPAQVPTPAMPVEADQGAVCQVTSPSPEVSIPVTEDVSTRPLSTASLLFKEESKEIAVPFKTSVLIGRKDIQAGNIPDIDLTEADKNKVTSRKHCCILHSNGVYKLKDLGSMNGTFLNGKRLESDVEYDLKNGDEIFFGKLACTFSCIV